MTEEPCHMPIGWNQLCTLPGDHPHDDGCETPLPRCRCTHGPSAHSGGYGECWQMPCTCETYRDPQETAK